MTRPRSQSKLGPPGFAVHARRSSNSRKERPAAPGPGGQGTALGYPPPPQASWSGVAAPARGMEGTPPAPPDLRERAPGGHPAAGPGRCLDPPSLRGLGTAPPATRPPRAGRSSGNPLPAFGH